MMRNSIVILILSFLLHFHHTSCQALAEAEIMKLCEASTITTCDQCLKAHTECAWCGKPPSGSLFRRCRKYSRLLQLGDCDPKDITHPVSNFTPVGNVALSTPGRGNNGSVVQLQPQNIEVNVRKGGRTKFNVTFRKVTDYPVDLYYLMDLSYSMRDDLDTLKNLGQRLATDIQSNVTADIQMGFGTFVDKVMMPFASTVPEQLKNPCIKIQDGGTCAPPFGFKHQQSISKNLDNFRTSVNATTISGNIDTPEGVFDALMQIAVCQNDIGWRSDASHLVVVTTDASFHMALDGKLAAILEANDMRCHLGGSDNENLSPSDIVYNKSKEQDYPSIGQLRSIFSEHKIQPIFAVTSEVRPLYEELRNLIPNSFVDELATDSSNIISIIKEAYDQLRGILDMTLDENIPPGIKLSYRTLCPNATEWKSESLSCNQISIGSEVVYEFEVEATDCGAVSSTPLTFTSNSLQERVTISFNFLCSCDCLANPAPSSPFCNMTGSLSCGVCQCDPGYEGSTCQCERKNEDVSLEEMCKMSASSDVCQGNGQCECGTCVCSEGYSRQYCQCSNRGCPTNNEGICGGSDKGVCENCDGNGRCRCINGWTLDPDIETCTCREELCRADTDNATCSGHGTCNCNRCECNDTSVYTGEHCETCISPICRGARQGCDVTSTHTCARCVNDAERLKVRVSDRCSGPCDGLPYQLVARLPDCAYCDDVDCPDLELCRQMNVSNFQPEDCTTQSNDSECNLLYKLVWSENNYLLLVKRFDSSTDCPRPINTFAIILPIVGGIVLIGLILLIAWKIYQTLRDKREWEKFENEMKASKWTKGQNPIFEKPSSRFENPTFEGN